MNKKFYATFYFVNGKSLEISFDAELNDFDQLKKEFNRLLSYSHVIEIQDHMIVCKNVVFLSMRRDD